MNLPNKLTFARVLLIPVFLAFYLPLGVPDGYLWALGVFVLASLTDIADGAIARRYGLVTDFGALMDPLADKLLIMAAMVCFVWSGIVHALPVILILAREFFVTSIRLIAAGKGTVISADGWGKIKTVCQMLWVALGLLALWSDSGLSTASPALWALFGALTWLVALVTVLSGVNYAQKNRSVFADR